MLSDAQDRFLKARDAIAVPAAPMSAIREAGCVSQPAKPRIRKRIGFGLLGGLAIVGVAAAAQSLVTTHFVVSPHAALEIREDRNNPVHGKYVRYPTDMQVAAAARATNFHAILPAGLPAGARVLQMFSNADTIMLTYDLPGAWRADNHLFWIILANNASLNAPSAPPSRASGQLVMKIGGEAAKGSQTWRIGDETVIVPESKITSAELAAVKAAMTAEAGRK